MNIFIQTNRKKIEAIKRQLIEYNYAGSYGGSINLMQVNNMIDGLLIEVSKLEEENIKLKQLVNQLQQKDSSVNITSNEKN